MYNVLVELLLARFFLNSMQQIWIKLCLESWTVNKDLALKTSIKIQFPSDISCSGHIFSPLDPMWPTECLQVKCMKIESWTRFWSCEKFLFRPYFLFPQPIWLILHRKSACMWRCAVTLNQISCLKVKVIADFFDITKRIL